MNDVYAAGKEELLPRCCIYCLIGVYKGVIRLYWLMGGVQVAVHSGYYSSCSESFSKSNKVWIKVRLTFPGRHGNAYGGRID
jgi:hypothetical protein